MLQASATAEDDCFLQAALVEQWMEVLVKSSTIEAQDNKEHEMENRAFALNSLKQSLESGEIRDAFPLSSQFYTWVLMALQGGWRLAATATAAAAHHLPRLPGGAASVSSALSAAPSPSPLVSPVSTITAATSSTSEDPSNTPRQDPLSPHLRPLYDITSALLRLPEFQDSPQAKECVLPSTFLSDLTQRLSTSNIAEEHAHLRTLMHWLYRHLVQHRPQIRESMVSLLGNFTRGPRECLGVRTCLEVLSCIIRGMQAVPSPTSSKPQLLPQQASLLHSPLLPLHAPQGMLSMRYSEPIIQHYHQSLVHCVVGLVRHDCSLAPEVMRGLGKCWPTAWEANSMKEILLLGEAEQVLTTVVEMSGGVVGAGAAKAATACLPLLVQTLGSPNARVAERAFKIITNGVLPRCFRADSENLDAFAVEEIKRERKKFIQTLMPIILQEGTFHWSATVNTQRGRTLKALSQIDPAAFASAAENLWGQNAVREADAIKALTSPQPGKPSAVRSKPDSQIHGGKEAKTEKPEEPVKTSTMGRLGVTPVPQGRPSMMARVGMASPSASATSSSGLPPGAGRAPTGMPPAGGMIPGRGRAPFARMTPPGGNMPISMMPGGRMPPPAGVAGQKGWVPCAAPFARPKSPSSPSALQEGEEGEQGGGGLGELAEEVEVSPVPASGAERVLQFSRHLLGPEADEEEKEEQAAKGVSEALSAVTPTLLPDLAFQELVFGNDLGSGAFATVRYARHIAKGEPQSRWPEYAVKVISTSKIKEMGYEASVRREITVLRHMSHPGIARLITSFRWRDGAYLVLEFASKGDLFSQLLTGGLEESLARFWCGEVLAALCSVHSLGFVYGDLKPENILLTGSGHAKLGDFGAVRPITKEAKELCHQAQLVLSSMRDGDWRVKAGLVPSISQTSLGGSQEPLNSAEAEGESNREEQMGEDDRMEGTAMYLAPELLAGGCSSVAGDVWAFGCVLYQTLTGHPPAQSLLPPELLSSSGASQHHHVHFANPDTTSEPGASLEFPSSVSQSAKDLVLSLLHPLPDKRLGCGSERGLEEIMDHPFFEGLDVPNLYRSAPPPAALRISAPAPDVVAAGEGRRQSSIMWTPKAMEAYSFTGRAYSMEPLVQEEGDWATASTTKKAHTIPIFHHELESLQE